MNEFFFSDLGLIFKDYLKFAGLHILLLTIFVKNLFHKKRVYIHFKKDAVNHIALGITAWNIFSFPEAEFLISDSLKLSLLALLFKVCIARNA